MEVAPQRTQKLKVGGRTDWILLGWDVNLGVGMNTAPKRCPKPQTVFLQPLKDDINCHELLKAEKTFQKLPYFFLQKLQIVHNN